MRNAKNITYIAVLVTLASVLHAIEMFIPNPLPLPGAKLGLANVVTLIALLFYGLKEGMLISFLRVTLGSLIGGTFLSVNFLMSLTGAIVSTLIMYFLFKYVKSLSIIGVSIVGAVVHNIVQLIVAYFIVATLGIFFYLPFLLAIGIPVGMLTGIIAKNAFKHLQILRITH
ncbi:heptaprenyl diphosphate synthase [Clostridium polyendosporum]|uniref:Heptaprenyl diphosphate synthase n=1 Tax=Clostridium polyendosporum TaxID=69208 RepID=A0A919VGT4_9CLOT|nr:Gx transporter family protein [Clostridium polyendosporum]GIM29700.1 heptaprenyl diphosphate synthase [Clostridium polyendosporum]